MKNTWLAGFMSIVIVAAPWSALAGGFVNSAVSWGTPTGIVDDTDVSTTGTLVMAHHFVEQGFGENTTVNGVTFTAFGITGGASPSAIGSHFNLHETTPGANLYVANYSPHNSPYRDLSGEYQVLLATSVYATAPSTMQLQMTDLTIGQTYQFQWWTNLSGPIFSSQTVTATAHGFAANVTLEANTAHAQGGVGQWATGTFTAADEMEQIDFVGNVAPYVTAFQLRNVTVVPEPATYAWLLGVPVLGLAIYRRRKRRGRKEIFNRGGRGERGERRCRRWPVL